MSGLLLLLVATVWFVISVLLVIRATRWIKAAGFRVLAGMVVFPVVLLLPLIDEMIAQPQFEALCRENAVLVIDAQAVRGRSVKLTFEPSNARLTRMAVPVTYSRVVFRDATTGEAYGSFNRYDANGGWLIRALGISEGDSPLWMRRSYCSPGEGAHQVATRLGFYIIN